MKMFVVTVSLSLAATGIASAAVLGVSKDIRSTMQQAQAGGTIILAKGQQRSQQATGTSNSKPSKNFSPSKGARP